MEAYHTSELTHGDIILDRKAEGLEYMKEIIE